MRPRRGRSRAGDAAPPPARGAAQLRGEGGLRGMLAPLKAHVIDAQSLDADLMRVLQGMWSEANPLRPS